MTTAGTSVPLVSRRGPAPAGPRASDLVLVLLGAAAVSAAPLLGIPPLLVGGLVCFAAAAVALLDRPRLAVQLTVVVVLLPVGLLPFAVQRLAELGTLVLAVAAHAREAARDRRPLVFGWPLAVLALFLLWSLVTATWSLAPRASLVQLRPYVVASVLLLLVVNVVRRREDLPALMNALALSGWVVLACSARSLATGGLSGGRLDVLDVNANQLGNVLLLTTAGVLWRQLSGTGGWRTVQTALYLGSALLVIALTGSRGSLMAFGVLLLGLGLTRPLRAWAAAGLALSLVALLAFPSAFTTVLARAEHPDPNQLSRLQLWHAGLSLVAAHPLGVGLGQGPEVLPHFINAEVSQDHFITRTTIPAHNPFIEVADETGVVGGALFAATLLLAAGTALVRGGRARGRGDPALAGYGAVVAATSAAFLLAWVKSGGESYNVTTYVLLALWLVPSRPFDDPAS